MRSLCGGAVGGGLVDLHSSTGTASHSRPAHAGQHEQRDDQCQALTDDGNGHQCTKQVYTRIDLCIQHLKMGNRVALVSKGAPASLLRAAAFTCCLGPTDAQKGSQPAQAHVHPEADSACRGPAAT